MTGGYPQPVVLDATVLSNFASTNSVSFLTTVLESPVVVPAVQDELERGLDAGHGYLDTVVTALGDELPIRSLSSDSGLQGIRDRLDPGEAESLLVAVEQGGTVATDDLAARKIAEQRDVSVTGSIGLLVIGVRSGRIDEETADEWLEIWREQRGYYAPIESVTEILDDPNS